MRNADRDFPNDLLFGHLREIEEGILIHVPVPQVVNEGLIQSLLFDHLKAIEGGRSVSVNFQPCCFQRNGKKCWGHHTNRCAHKRGFAVRGPRGRLTDSKSKRGGTPRVHARTADGILRLPAGTTRGEGYHPSPVIVELPARTGLRASGLRSE